MVKRASMQGGAGRAVGIRAVASMTEVIQSRPSSVKRRLEILRASIDVFWRKGYAGASLRLIAASAGIEKGHLTYYFRTKDDLLFELVDDLQDQFGRGLDASVSVGGKPIEVLYRVLRQHVALACVQHRQTSVAYDNMRFLSPERRAVVTEKREQYEHCILELVEKCQRSRLGLVRLPAPILSKVVIGIVSWTPYWYDEDGPLSPEDLATMLASRAVASLFPVDAVAALPEDVLELPEPRWTGAR